MGWALLTAAVLLMLVSFGLGLWPVSLLSLIYIVYSIRRPRRQRASALGQGPIPGPRHPWRRYAAGGALVLLAMLALGGGGTLSPAVLLLGGLACLLWPRLRRSLWTNQVVPMTESVLLRSRAFPFLWHALAEVKLEAQDQTRGVASMEGSLLVFAGKAPTTVQVVSVYAFGHKEAEMKVVKKLRRETRMLSQRGAHILPLDSSEAASRLSLELERLKLGTEDFDAVSSLPFDVMALRVKDGLVESHRAFSIVDAGTAVPSIPSPDLPQERAPLLAEVVEEIGKRHGWPGPDEYSPFLAALDASRTEPIADRLRAKGEEAGRLTVETPGGAEVRLTRAQLRAVARIYG